METTEIDTIENEIIEEEHHTKPIFYVFIAAILFGLTALEIWLYYLEKDKVISSTPLVIMLILIASVKFFLVAAWFMHLKGDSKVFSIWFGIGGLCALVIFTCTLLALQVMSPLAQS